MEQKSYSSNKNSLNIQNYKGFGEGSPCGTGLLLLISLVKNSSSFVLKSWGALLAYVEGSPVYLSQMKKVLFGGIYQLEHCFLFLSLFFRCPNRIALRYSKVYSCQNPYPYSILFFQKIIRFMSSSQTVGETFFGLDIVFYIFLFCYIINKFIEFLYSLLFYNFFDVIYTDTLTTVRKLFKIIIGQYKKGIFPILVIIALLSKAVYVLLSLRIIDT